MTQCRTTTLNGTTDLCNGSKEIRYATKSVLNGTLEIWNSFGGFICGSSFVKRQRRGSVVPRVGRRETVAAGRPDLCQRSRHQSLAAR
jgi:hypothetical protein